MSNELVKQKSIVNYLSGESVKENIQKTLGDKTPQFIASIASLVTSNAKIAVCDQKSILSSCLIAASLDLPINQNLGFAYIIPYKDQAQFQMGYKGFIQLALRSNQFRLINVSEVKTGELIENNRLTGELKFEWIAENRDQAQTIGYVAYFELTNGFSKQLYMTTEQLKKHGVRFSQTFKKGYGLWSDDFDSMAKKTVLKLLISKFAPMTTDIQKAVLADQAVVRDNGFEYPDNQPLDPTEEANEKETARIIKHIENSITEKELKLCEESLKDQNQDVRELFESKLKELSDRS